MADYEAIASQTDEDVMQILGSTSIGGPTLLALSASFLFVLPWTAGDSDVDVSVEDSQNAMSLLLPRGSG
jgi:hypothetical protein